MTKKLPPQDVLTSLFAYHNGVLINAPGRRAARKAVVAMHQGYYVCRIEGKVWPVHRVVWSMFHGEIPEGAVIDHINGDKADNRISNLRATTPFVNANNRVVADSRNRCGLLGVHLKERNGVRRYYARISDGGKSVALGGFSTPELAQAAYFAAKERMKPGFSLASRLL